MPLSNGYLLNRRYRIDSLIAQGGSGNVYRAWDLNLNTPVALKENLDTSPDAVQQFVLESRMLANLRHENLPYVIDHFSLPGQGQYLVMEYIEGQDLRAVAARARGKPPEAQVLSWIAQVCEALIYLHSQSPPIIHRDVKPVNIKITPQGRVVLVDFGAGRLYGPTSRTAVAARPVDQGFTPPEQLEAGYTDERSDIYAVGATLYAALTGQQPADSLQRKMGMSLQTPRQLNPSISMQTEHAILRAMELAPERRFSSVLELRDALGGPAGAPVAPTQVVQRAGMYAVPATTEATADSAGRSRSRVIVAVLALAAMCLFGGLLAGMGFYWLVYSPFQPTPTQGIPGLSETGTALALQLVSPTKTLPLPVSDTPTPSGVPSLVPTLTPNPTSTLPPTLPYSPTPTLTQTLNPAATWQPCPGTYASRLHTGMRAYVSYNPPLPNRVRSEPNSSSVVLGFLQVGERMDILEGPTCSDQWIWWRVRSLDTGLTGWTAEGDATNYWLVPMP